MAESDQLVGDAGTALNVMELFPCVAPNPEPLIATEVPGAPDVGAALMMFGPTVKFWLFVGWPLMLMYTGPEVAPAGTGTMTV